MSNEVAFPRNLSDAELVEKRASLRSKIDDNDGRLTAESSADLDYWHDQLIDVNREIERRAMVSQGIQALPVTPRVLKITVDVPAEKREQFHRLWEQILSDEDAPINQQVKTVRKTRHDVIEEGKAALFRLYEIARGDTGQSRVIARFLVGLYNGNAYPFDLTDLRTIDDALFEDCMALLRMDARHCVQEVHNYLDDGDRKWKQMISDWHLKDRSSY